MPLLLGPARPFFHSLGRLGSQQLFHPLGCGGFVDTLDGGKLPYQPVESSLVDLPLTIGLLRLARVTVKVANHFGDRARVAGGNLSLVFLSAAAPHRPLGT